MLFDPKNKNVIYQRLIYSRKRNHLSQQELAQRMQSYGLNVDQHAISKIVRNSRAVSDLELLGFCRALGVQPQWLLGEDLSKLEEH